MKRLVHAALAFSVLALLFNAESMRRTAEENQLPPVAAVVERAAAASEQIGAGRLRAAVADLSAVVGIGVERLDVSGYGDVYLFAGDSMMGDIAPELSRLIDDRTDGDATSYEIVRKGSKAGDDLWGWETDLPAEVRRTGADIVMLVLDVEAADLGEYRTRAGELVDLVVAAGARQVVWIEHPISAAGEFEAGRSIRHRALSDLDDARPELIVFDPSSAIVNSSGGFTSHIVTGDGSVVRVRETDGFHLTDAGARLVAAAVAGRLGI